MVLDFEGYHHQYHKVLGIMNFVLLMNLTGLISLPKSYFPLSLIKPFPKCDILSSTRRRQKCQDSIEKFG